MVDGNYSRVRDIVWRKSALVVWLDLSFKTVFWRTFLRTVIIMVTCKKLWNSDIVVFDALFSPSSLPLWVINWVLCIALICTCIKVVTIVF